MSKFSRRHVIGGAGSAILVGSTGVAKAAPNTTSSLTADVCIVGAGFAGLAAALRLKQAGASVIVLEARGQVGGRSWTVATKDGGWVDWGGQWVGSSQTVRDPVGPIHWAGTETSTDWPSFIDIRSGEREAEAIRKSG